jgi:hypothetical protein
MKKEYFSSLLPAFLLVLILSVSYQAHAATYAWHTFGGPDTLYTTDATRAMAVDSSGNVYLTGTSHASWIVGGMLGHAPKHGHSGGDYDIFVLSFDSSGQYRWHTFYGSDSDLNGDGGYGISVTADGYVHVTGRSSATWNGPGLLGDTVAPINPHDAGKDAMVLKLDSEDGTYAWHTFLGSSADDNSSAIITDGSSNAYISFTGGPVSGVMKLNSSGVKQWQQYYTPFGSAADGTAIALDGSGNIYVTGTTYATWNGPSGDAPKHAFTSTGNWNIFVVKLDSSGGYLWHTFYGAGTENGERVKAMAVDSNNYIYIAGTSGGNWSGLTYKHAHSGGLGDTFVLKLDSSGVHQWHTFYGANPGSSSAGANALTLDGSSNIYLAGYGRGWNGPGTCSTEGVPPCPLDDSPTAKIYVMKLDNTGEYQWHTFDGSVSATGIGLYGSALYVGGYSDTDWVEVPIAPLHAHQGGRNSFVMKLDLTCANDPVRNAGTSQRYWFVTDALYEVLDSGTIMMQARDFNEDLSSPNNFWVKLIGGYECGFGSNPGITTINSLTIKTGSLIIDKIAIK